MSLGHGIRRDTCVLAAFLGVLAEGLDHHLRNTVQVAAATEATPTTSAV
jgi:hypothetical protein